MLKHRGVFADPEQRLHFEAHRADRLFTATRDAIRFPRAIVSAGAWG
jgi:hypothetical protein